MESTYFVHLCGSLALRYFDPDALDELVLMMNFGSSKERALASSYLAECATRAYSIGGIRLPNVAEA